MSIKKIEEIFKELGFTKKKRYLFQKKGLYLTLEILKAHGSFMILSEFYKEFNKISYYNAFYRVRNQMIELGLIKIIYSKIPTIANTIRGGRVRRLLEELITIEEND